MCKNIKKYIFIVLIRHLLHNKRRTRAEESHDSMPLYHDEENCTSDFVLQKIYGYFISFVKYLKDPDKERLNEYQNLSLKYNFQRFHIYRLFTISFIHESCRIYHHSLADFLVIKTSLKIRNPCIRALFKGIQRSTKIAFKHHMIFATSKYFVSKKGKNILLCLIHFDIQKGNYIATDN